MQSQTPSSSLVRTQAFQACSTGSNPVGVAKFKGPLLWRPFQFVISPFLIVAFSFIFSSQSFCEETPSCTKCELLKEPAWVQELVKQEESQPPANPPARLDKCLYKGKTTYYLPPRCCDIESTLLDEEGKEICSPDGGYTGNGDGRCPDFYFGEIPTECKTIWKDERRQ